MSNVKVWVKPSVFMPKVKMEFEIPEGYDTEEYIDMYFDAILNDSMRYNVEWDFA